MLDSKTLRNTLSAALVCLDWHILCTAFVILHNIIDVRFLVIMFTNVIHFTTMLFPC